VDPTYEFAAALIARLKANSAVAAFVGTKIYDRPPEGASAPTSPYIALGPSDATTDDADCIDGMEIAQQIDVYSWGSGEAYSSAQVRKIAHTVRECLHDAEMPLTSNALVTMRHRITRYSRGSDGITQTANISMTAFVEVP
jgi:hypothetical protein